jgi:hypothetical protein
MHSPRSRMGTVAAALICAFVAGLFLAGSGTTDAREPQTLGASGRVAATASDLRLNLDQLLSEHAELAMEAMQKGYDGAPDFQAVANQLNTNTQSLTNAISSVYGAAAGQQFNTLWMQHIGFFVDYTKAVKGNDAAAKATAQNNLNGYIQGITKLLSGANPNLPAATVTQVFTEHVQELEGALDSYAAKDYATTYSTQVKAIDHMFMSGDALAAAIAKQFPDKFPGQASGGAVDLRGSLDQLLSEHAYLAMVAMQKGYDGAADFQAAADQLNTNTQNLTNAISSVYGADAGNQFKTLWMQHIGFFVDYTKALKANDATGKTTAQNNLNGYIQGITKLLSGANPNLPAAAVTQVFTEHVQELLGAINSYAAKDYATTYSTQAQAIDHMFMSGDAVAAAIAQQFPAKFPGGTPAMPNTGTGGLLGPSPSGPTDLVWVVAALVAVLGLLGGTFVFVQQENR